jgi:hypothetical protein
MKHRFWTFRAYFWLRVETTSQRVGGIAATCQCEFAAGVGQPCTAMAVVSGMQMTLDALLWSSMKCAQQMKRLESKGPARLWQAGPGSGRQGAVAPKGELTEAAT